MALALIPPGRRGNKFIVARGRIKGEVYEFSTGTTDTRLARRVAAEFEAKVRSEPVAGKVTFEQAARRYLAFKPRSRADELRIEHVLDDRTFRRRLIGDIVPAHIHDLAISRYPSPAPTVAATRNREIVRPVVTILHHAAEAGLCAWIRVKKFEEAPVKPRALELDAATALIEATETPEQRRLLLWLFLQGTRITRTLKLDWDALDLDSGAVTLWNAKGSREETFPLHELVLNELRSVPAAEREGRVFAWSNKTSLRRWLPRVCEKAGVAFTSHMARHTLATAVDENQEALKTAMGILGHSQASSTLRYQAPRLDVLRVALNRVRLPKYKALK